MHTEPTTSSEPDDNTTTIILIAVFCSIGAVIVLVIVVLLMYMLYKKHCEHQQQTEQPKPRKRKRKLSITDYSARILSRSSLVDDDVPLNKKSAGEVIGGVNDGAVVTKVLDSYEPPKKEVSLMLKLIYLKTNVNVVVPLCSLITLYMN